MFTPRVPATWDAAVPPQTHLCSQKEGVRAGRKSVFRIWSTAVSNDFSVGTDPEKRRQIAMGDGGLTSQPGSTDDSFKKAGHDGREKGSPKREVRNLASRTGIFQVGGTERVPMRSLGREEAEDGRETTGGSRAQGEAAVGWGTAFTWHRGRSGRVGGTLVVEQEDFERVSWDLNSVQFYQWTR